MQLPSANSGRHRANGRLGAVIPAQAVPFIFGNVGMFAVTGGKATRHGKKPAVAVLRLPERTDNIFRPPACPRFGRGIRIIQCHGEHPYHVLPLAKSAQNRRIPLQFCTGGV